MIPVQDRFPRTHLWKEAADLEEQINKQIDKVHAKLHGPTTSFYSDTAREKLQDRYDALMAARSLINEARVELFQCK